MRSLIEDGRLVEAHRAQGRLSHNLADDRRRRRHQLRLVGEISDRFEVAGHDTLLRHGSAFDASRRRLRVSAGIDQALDDDAEVREAHQHNDRLHAHQGVIVQGVGPPPIFALGGHHGDRSADLSQSDGDVGGCGNSQSAGHAGHNLALHSGLQAGNELLPASSKQQRISAFEADNKGPVSRLLHQQCVDLILRVTRPAGVLAYVDDVGIRRDFVEQFMRDEPIVHHDVGLPEQLQTFDGNQTRIAGPRAH